MPETQPRVGHLRSVSTNDTKKTGRPVPTGQPKPGHLSSKSKNDVTRAGGAPAPLTTKGYHQASSDPTPKNVGKVGTVRPAKGGSY